MKIESDGIQESEVRNPHGMEGRERGEVGQSKAAASRTHSRGSRVSVPSESNGEGGGILVSQVVESTRSAKIVGENSPKKRLKTLKYALAEGRGAKMRSAEGGMKTLNRRTRGAPHEPEMGRN